MTQLKDFQRQAIQLFLLVLVLQKINAVKTWSLPKTDDYVITKPYTITLPTFENPKKVAKENWENMYWETYGGEYPQYQGQDAYQPVANPSYYVVNRPLAYPSSYTSGYYPPKIMI